jgi:AI-2 transport protein TqsA
MAESAPRIGYRSLLTLAAFVVVIAGLRAAGPILLPLLLAALLSVLSTPPMLWLSRRRVPSPIAVLLPVALAVGAIFAFGGLLATSVRGFDQALPGYSAALASNMQRLLGWLESLGVNVPENAIADAFDPGAVMGLVGWFLGNLMAALSGTALVILCMLFMLLEVAGFPRKVRAALDDPDADLSRFSSTMHEVQRYLAIKTAISLATGAMIWLWLVVLGVDFPLLWAIVAFLLNYIPSVGSVIAAIPAVLVSIVQPDLGPGYGVLVAAGYLVVNVAFGNILEPQIMGRELGLSPLIVVVSLVFWGWVWWPLGMLLAVPLTMIVRIMLEQSDDLRWIAILMGPAPPRRTPDERTEGATAAPPPDA